MGERGSEALVFDEATANRLITEISSKISAVAETIESGDLEETRKAIEPIIIGLSDNVEAFLQDVKGGLKERSKERNQIVQFEKNLAAGLQLARRGDAALLMSSLLTIIALYLPTTLSVEYKDKKNLDLFKSAVESLQTQDAAAAAFKKKFKDLKIEVTKHEYTQNNTIDGASDKTERGKRTKERRAHRALRAIYEEIEKRPAEAVDNSGLTTHIENVDQAEKALGRVDLDGLGRVLTAFPLPKTNDLTESSRRWENEDIRKLYANKTSMAQVKIGRNELIALQDITQALSSIQAKTAINTITPGKAVLTAAEQYVQAVVGVAQQGKAAEGTLYRTALADHVRIEQMTQVYTSLNDAGELGKLLPGIFEVILNNDVDNILETPSKDTNLSDLKAIRKYQNNKKNPIGRGTLMEGQKAKIFETARQHAIDTKKLTPDQADAEIASNMAEVLSLGTGVTDTEKAALKSVDSPRKLYDHFLVYPASLTRLRMRIEKQPEYFGSMLEHGKDYLSYEAQKITQRENTKTQSPEDLLRETIKNYDALDNPTKAQLISKVDTGLVQQRETIDKQIAAIDAELAAPGTPKERRKLLKKNRETLIALKKTMTSQEYKTRVARTMRGLGVAHVDDLTSVGAGVSREVALNKGRLAKHVVDSITISGGVLQGIDGQNGEVLDNDIIGTNLALGVSIGKGREINKAKTMTLFYSVGVGGGLNLQGMTMGRAPYALVGTAYEKNGTTWFAGVNGSPVGIGASVGVNVDVMKKFDTAFEKVKTGLTQEVQSIISAAKGDFSYTNIRKIVEGTFGKDKQTKKHLDDYARILSDILQQVASDPALKKNLATKEGIELISTMIAGALMDSYNNDVEKLSRIKLTGGAIGVQLIFTPWGIGALPTGGLFFSIIKKSAHVPDKGSYDREQKFKEHLSGNQDTQFTFTDIDEVNVLMRTQDRNDETGEIEDLPGVSEAKLEVWGSGKDYVFIPQSFFEYFNLELGDTVPYMRLDGTEQDGVPEATDKIGVLVPAKAKPVVLREFYGNHQVVTLAVVSQLSDKRERVLPTQGVGGDKAALDTYNKGLKDVELYLSERDYLKQAKEGMRLFDEGAVTRGGRALFEPSKDPILDMTTGTINLPLRTGHGITLERMDASYKGRLVVKSVAGQDYLVMPTNMSIQFIQAKSQTKATGPKKTYLLVKEELAASATPRREMSLQMTETFDDQLLSDLSEIVSPNPDPELLDFLRSSDAAEMFMRRRYEYQGGKDMHEAYYQAIDGRNYKTAAKIAVGYIDEAIKKSVEPERARLQTLRKRMSFDPVSSTTAVKERTIANLHYIYASLSRVTMTEKKHLTIDGAKVEFKGLIGELSTTKYSSATRTKLAEVGDRILTTPGTFDDTMTDEKGSKVKVRTWLEKTLNVSYDAAGRGRTEALHIKGGKNAPIQISPEYRIAFLLVKMEQVAVIRTESFKKRLEKEKHYSGDPAALAELMKIREESIHGMPNKPLANGNMKQVTNAIGLVAGYGGVGNTNLHIDEKFVYHPYMVQGSEVVIDKKVYPRADVHKKYYLDNLQEKNPEVLESIARQIVAKLKKNGFDATRLEKSPGVYNFENLKNVIIGGGKLNGKPVEGLESIEVTFEFNIFTECLNEDIVMKNLKITFKKKIPFVPKVTQETPIVTELITTPVSRKLGYVNYTVANTAVRQQKNLPVLGVVVGRTPKPKQQDAPSNTEPTLAEPEDFSTIDFNNVVYKNDITFTVNGETFTNRPGFVLPDGTIYAKNIQGDRYKILPNGNGVSVEKLLVGSANHLNAVVGTQMELLEQQKQSQVSTSYLSGDDPDASELKLEIDEK